MAERSNKRWRSALMTIRLHPIERRIILRAAERDGKSISEWLRAAAVWYLDPDDTLELDCAMSEANGKRCGAPESHA